MKYFFRRKVPQARDILVIESGSPEVVQRVLGSIRAIFPNARYYLLTCRPDPSPGSFATVFHTSDYPSWGNKLRLLLTFRRKKWEVMVILCTGERLLWRWKISALLLVPAKVLIVNEHADFFWLHWENWRTLRKLLAVRWGLNLDELFSAILRILVFPFIVLFLLSTAVFLYMRRWRRLAAWRLSALLTMNQPKSEVSSIYQHAPKEKHSKRGVVSDGGSK